MDMQNWMNALCLLWMLLAVWLWERCNHRLTEANKCLKSALHAKDDDYEWLEARATRQEEYIVVLERGISELKSERESLQGQLCGARAAIECLQEDLNDSERDLEVERQRTC